MRQKNENEPLLYPALQISAKKDKICVPNLFCIATN